MNVPYADIMDAIDESLRKNRGINKTLECRSLYLHLMQLSPVTNQNTEGCIGTIIQMVVFF